MDMPEQPFAFSWYRSSSGRRFGVEFAAIIGIKLFLLTLIWFVCFRPHPRPDTAPAAIESHLLAPAAEATHDR